MSYLYDRFRMENDAGGPTNRKNCPYRKAELKRSVGRAFAPGPGFFWNKRQTTEAVKKEPMSGIPNRYVPMWDKRPDFRSFSTESTDHLYGSEPTSIFDLAGRSSSSLGTGYLNPERYGYKNQFGREFSIGLSPWNKMNDYSPYFDYAGIRDNVDLLGYYDGDMLARMGHSYNRWDSNAFSDDTISNNRSADKMSFFPTNRGTNPITMSSDRAFPKAGDNSASVGNNGDSSIRLMGRTLSKGSNSALPSDPAHYKGKEIFLRVGSSYNKANENVFSMGPSCINGNNSVISMGRIADKRDKYSTYEEGGSSMMFMSQNYNKGQSGTMSFGGVPETFERDSDGRLIIRSHQSLPSPPPPFTFQATGHQGSAEGNAGPAASVTAAGTSSINTNSKNKRRKSQAKRATRNNFPKKGKMATRSNFPTNVKCLLATGVLDGVPVMYVSWSREIQLPGVIEGIYYLCGCKKCKLTEGLNAFEFEEHAGCKSKHPNNRVHFENGRSVFEVVQELKNTPKEKLIEVIPTMTGSPINEKNFNVWKASFQREMELTAGRNEKTVLSKKKRNEKTVAAGK